MKVTTHPSQLKGIVQAPASKSTMQRACAAALLRKGETIIINPGHSNDDKSALDIIQRLGAKAIFENGEWKIKSWGSSLKLISSSTITCINNSGERKMANKP